MRASVKVVSIILFILVANLMLLIIYWPEAESPPEETSNQEQATNTTKNPRFPADVTNRVTTITEVLSANTIKAEKDIISLIGVLAPTPNPASGSLVCTGEDAMDKMKELVLGQKVSLETDKVKKTNSIFPRYVYLEDGTFINRLMVAEGFADTSFINNNIRYKDELEEAKQDARDKKWGIWSDACTQ